MENANGFSKDQMKFQQVLFVGCFLVINWSIDHPLPHKQSKEKKRDLKITIKEEGGPAPLTFISTLPIS